RASLLGHLNLSDGGVYDNLGIEPVDRGYETVIISDGGSPFGYVRKGGAIGRLLRVNSVIMRQVGSLRKRIFFTGISREQHSGGYISIGSEGVPPVKAGAFNGYRGPETRTMISSIRTDLDLFDDSEARILENHGYYEMFHRLTAKLSYLLPTPLPSATTPHPAWTDELAVAEALRDSGKRLSARRIWTSIRRKIS